MKLSYKDSGVDIAEGNALVSDLKGLVAQTFNKNVIGGIGSFSGAFALNSGFKEPVLLAATDGVGTKLKLAIQSGKLNSVGIDLVAMCVNDLICNFGEPLFFLDYYATGKLDKNAALAVISGIVEGCKLAECALIGGESAEMPGMYSADDFDLAGFSVGIAEKADLKPKNIAPGDVLVGLQSSGFHSNGYSLVRKIISQNSLNLNAPLGELLEKLGDFNLKNRSNKADFKICKGADSSLLSALLAPTRIYVKTFKKIKSQIKALAHITGGGLLENLPRVLPNSSADSIESKNKADSIESENSANFKGALCAEISQEILIQNEPPIFAIARAFADNSELYRAFNMGVGLVLVCAKENAENVVKICQENGENAFIMGSLRECDSIKTNEEIVKIC